MSKRLPGFGVLAIGVVVLIVLFSTNLFTVGSAFEELTDEFRPIMSDDAIAAAQADVAGLAAVSEEFASQVAPAVAQTLQMTPEDLATYLGTSFPAVAAGVAALPEIVTQFTSVVGLLEQQQSNFEQADQIPTSNLPASTVPWIILLIGIGAIVVGIVMLGRSDSAWLVATSFGVVVIAISLLLSFLPKASAADDLNAALKPVYTPDLVAQSGQALGVVRAMGQQMQGELLPALAQQLQLDTGSMQAFVGQFPATATALESLGESTERFQTTVTAFASQLENYDTINNTELYPIALVVLVSGLLIMVCGIWLFIVARREQPPPEPVG